MFINAALTLTKNEENHRYNLRAIIYHGENHFTSRIIKPSGQIWYHDGILTGGECKPDGMLSSFPAQYLKTSTDTNGTLRRACGVIYVSASN
ncbi:hypothetical protein C8R43DRAFT_883521 [Mycena crocata]|nr:hypothetical protein C8R43DRAFT_900808 [Mycena crocata]KAJ7156925.1 hypothetical protein C8R43DRAFT_883521 [Mycena crocata]